MTSWRDETSDQAQDDLDNLLDLGLRTGQEQLEGAGEFYPFAVALDDAGESRLVQPELPARKGVADVAEVHELCWQALAAEAGSLRAVAVVTNVGGAGGDAVAVALEHRDGVAIEVFLPYVTQGKVNGKKPAQKHRFGDLTAAEGQPRLWA
jgi:hypothetical protein